MTRASLLFVMLPSLGPGCGSSSSPATDWHALYKECVQPSSFEAQGGVLYASFVFADGCDRPRLARRIKRGLETGIESAEWPYDGMLLLSPPITEQEFWALALGDLTGGEFSVRMFESDAQRKASLRRFLTSVELP